MVGASASLEPQSRSPGSTTHWRSSASRCAQLADDRRARRSRASSSTRRSTRSPTLLRARPRDRRVERRRHLRDARTRHAERARRDIARDAGRRATRRRAAPRRAASGREADAARRSRATGATWTPAATAPQRRALAQRARRARRDGAGAWPTAMDFGFLFDPERKLLSIGYRVDGRQARPELLRPARLRSAARELRRDRQGRRPGAALVPARPRR